MILLEKDEIARILERLASQVVERYGLCGNLVLVGIQRRGAYLAHRLAAQLQERCGKHIALGTLDINLYRDDWTSLAGKPHIGQSSVPCPVDRRVVILIDDVLFSGRTVRAALEALLDYGRPSAVELMVLIDRGHRELPIQPDYVGRTIQTRRDEHVDVLLEELDGMDAVRLDSRPELSPS